MILNRRDILKLGCGGAAVLLAGPGFGATDAPTKPRLALVVERLGDPVFDEIHAGALEAAKEIDTIELLYEGPLRPTGQAQIELVEKLIGQHIDGLMISAVDTAALLPACRKALQQGVKVVSFNSPVAAGGRLLHLDPTDPTLVGVKCVEMIAKTLHAPGEVVILCAQGIARLDTWISQMKREWVKPDYAALKLAAVARAEDVPENAYAESRSLLSSFPTLKGIVALTPTGSLAAAKAVLDAGAAGRVFVSGLGLPSQLKEAVLAGAVDSFAMWNPVDLGYAVTTVTAEIMSGKASSAADAAIPGGRLGDIKVGADGTAILAPELAVFDRSNIETFAGIF